MSPNNQRSISWLDQTKVSQEVLSEQERPPSPLKTNTTQTKVARATSMRSQASYWTTWNLQAWLKLLMVLWGDRFAIWGQTQEAELVLKRPHKELVTRQLLSRNRSSRLVIKYMQFQRDLRVVMGWRVPLKLAWSSLLSAKEWSRAEMLSQVQHQEWVKLQELMVPRGQLKQLTLLARKLDQKKDLAMQLCKEERVKSKYTKILMDQVNLPHL